jgi:hypothetical protein
MYKIKFSTEIRLRLNQTITHSLLLHYSIVSNNPDISNNTPSKYTTMYNLWAFKLCITSYKHHSRTTRGENSLLRESSSSSMVHFSDNVRGYVVSGRDFYEIICYDDSIAVLIVTVTATTATNATTESAYSQSNHDIRASTENMFIYFK